MTSTKTKRDSSGGAISHDSSPGHIAAFGAPAGFSGTCSAGALAGPPRSIVIVIRPEAPAGMLICAGAFAVSGSAAGSWPVLRTATWRTGTRLTVKCGDVTRTFALPERCRGVVAPEGFLAGLGASSRSNGLPFSGSCGTGGRSGGGATSVSSCPTFSSSPNCASVRNFLKCLMIATLTCGTVSPLT